MSKNILEYDPKTVTSHEKGKNDDKNLESKELDKSIEEWIGRPFKPPLRNKYEEYEDKEEDFGTPLSSTEDAPPRR